jgi:hypothetical protein
LKELDEFLTLVATHGTFYGVWFVFWDVIAGMKEDITFDCMIN